MRTEADASASSDVSATLGTSYCTPFVPPAAEQGSEGIDGTAGEPVPESCQLVNHKNRLLIGLRSSVIAETLFLDSLGGERRDSESDGYGTFRFDSRDWEDF